MSKDELKKLLEENLQIVIDSESTGIGEKVTVYLIFDGELIVQDSKTLNPSI